MFIYRPHLHQLDGTITPDLIVDVARLHGHQTAVVLSDQVVLGARSDELTAAWVFVAARYGTLVAPAFLIMGADAGSAALCHVARSAWRLPDISDHLPRLELSLSWTGAAASAAGSMACAVPSVASEPGRASAWCVPVAHTACPGDAATVCLAVRDPVHARTLEHRVFAHRSQASSG